MGYRLMSYNIEQMRQLFFKGEVHPEARARVAAIGQVITEVSPHILGIVEASDREHHHELFMEETGLTKQGYQLVKSPHKRTRQDLVFYYRDCFEVVSVDDQISFYDEWIEDIDEDGIKEVCAFERKPLEVLFRHRATGTELLIILVATKSKGVFSISDFMRHQYLALANRKRQLAQTKKIRERVEDLFEKQSGPFMLMGDFNDEPGLDSMERMIGASSIETVMGSIFEPERILCNALWHMSGDKKLAKELFTTEYPDLIVANLGKHKGWLDHIMVAPSMINGEAPVQLTPKSGRVAEKHEAARLASDHFAVFCDVTFKGDPND